MNQSDEPELRQEHENEQQTFFQWAKGIINSLFQFQRPSISLAEDTAQENVYILYQFIYLICIQG